MSILSECPVCRKKQLTRNKRCKCGEDLDQAKRSGRVKYWISFRLPNGKQRREMVGYSIEDARAADGKRRGQKKEGRIFDMLPASKMTFNELSKWYLKLKSVVGLEYFPMVKMAIDRFNEIHGDTQIQKIKQIDIEDYRVAQKETGLSDSYVDKLTGCVKTMVNKAFENDMIDGRAVKVFRKVKKLLKRNSNARDRVLSAAEFKSLTAALENKTLRHIRGIVATAYYTGMRRGEILGLKWSRVDLVRREIRLRAEDTKDREPRSIPICDELYEVFQAIPDRLSEADGSNFVFKHQGKPITDIRGAFKKACDDAGTPCGRGEKNGFTFHDLRHTLNTNMRKAGVAESVIMAITGHSTREMFDRYNTVDKDDVRKAVNALGVFFASVDQSVDHGRAPGKKTKRKAGGKRRK